jgi:hypothetical protein
MEESRTVYASYASKSSNVSERSDFGGCKIRIVYEIM